jgi:chitinase
LDFEGSHIPGGEEAEKVGTQIKRLVESRRAGGSDFWLTAAPEWPYVTPYSYGGLFSQNYKQLFGAIGMDVFTYIWPQMYNQGQANGIKGPKGKASPADNIAKFLAEMVWATSTDEGLDASGNAGIKIPLGKLVLGIPAAQGAAGGEMTYVAKPADITRAYQLAKAQGTEITGFMTWSADFDNMKIDHYGHVHEPWATVDAIIKG